MDTQSPDSLSSRVWLMLVVVGAVLALIGWYRLIG
jgi:hypothetical protein